MSEFRYFIMLVFVAIAGLVLMISYTQPLAVLDSEIHHVVYVISGSEFAIETGDIVRLAGVEDPVWPDPDYSHAQLKLIDLVLDKDVLLEKDLEDTDMHGRFIRNVYFNDLFINEEIIKSGWTRASEEPCRYKDILLAAQYGAQNKREGAWK